MLQYTESHFFTKGKKEEMQGGKKEKLHFKRLKNNMQNEIKSGKSMHI